MLSELSVQPPLSDEQRRSLMALFDANKDGEISLTEFRDWILKDQLWQPASVTASELGTPDLISQLIASCVDLIVDSAFDALNVGALTSVWTVTTNSSLFESPKVTMETDQGRRNRSETGSILYQRVTTFQVNDLHGSDASSADNAVESVFQQFDTDSSGVIDVPELIGLLSALGLHVPERDARLLMHRLESALDVNDSVSISEFREYAERLTQPSARSETLQDALIALERAASSDSQQRQLLQDTLQQLHWGMRDVEVAAVCRTLRADIGLDMTEDVVRRITNALYFCEIVPAPSNPETVSPLEQSSEATHSDSKLLEVHNSGDILNLMIFAGNTTTMSAEVKAFDVRHTCRAVAAHLEEVTKTSTVESIWTSVFGADTSTCVNQRQFMEKLIRSGLTITQTSNNADKVDRRLITKLHLGLTLDALRAENGNTDDVQDLVSFGLFTVMMRRQRIDELEGKFAHALTSRLKLSGGQVWRLATVSIVGNQLVIRSVDPVRKLEMNYVFDASEYTTQAIQQLCSTTWPSDRVCIGGGRESWFTGSPTGLVTDATYPRLHDAFRKLMARFRVATDRSISAQQQSVTYLALVEGVDFLQSLRDALVCANLPFFWAVSPVALEFSVDQNYLTQTNRATFQQLVVDSVTKKTPARPLYSLVKFTASSLVVRYEIVGKNAVVTSPWEDFQALLRGEQRLFATLELRPQGDVFTTRLDQGGSNGAPKWNFKENMTMREPDRVDHRIDASIVYTDTAKVLTLPVSRGGGKKITFAPADASSTDGHFMVLSVRKAMPSKNGEVPRLYCTAYDPITACDYAVDGYPDDWSVDFFNPSVHRDYESRWQAMLSTLSLGITLTPKMSIKVFNRQSKAEVQVGECEVSVCSAIAQEGHLFDEWVDLTDPQNPTKTVGRSQCRLHLQCQETQCYRGSSPGYPCQQRLGAPAPYASGSAC
ncbi:hypothetical protein PINS_up002841 [Pythium insidiosum]|nr:hypothetical protein PINS_up002841 [Pythium insidiosum]